MIDLGSEQNLRGHHGVLVGQEELSIEHATFIRGLGGTGDFDDEVTGVVGVGFSVNSDDGLLHETLGILHDTRVSHNLIILIFT